jgi:hypothetical protein
MALSRAEARCRWRRMKRSTWRWRIAMEKVGSQNPYRMVPPLLCLLVYNPIYMYIWVYIYIYIPMGIYIYLFAYHTLTCYS